MTKREDMFEIDMGRIIRGLWRKSWVMVLTMAVCAALAFGYASLWAEPRYQANVLLYIVSSAEEKQSVTQSELMAAQSLTQTCEVILHSRGTLHEVIRQGELDCGWEELSGMLSGEAVNDTEIFQIQVTHTDPEMSAHIANTIAAVLPEKIMAIVDGSMVKVVDLAQVPDQPVSPNTKMLVAVGALMGMLTAAAVVVIRALLDDAIQDLEDLQSWEVPVLARIREAQGEEDCRLLGASLDAWLEDVSGCRSIGLTGERGTDLAAMQLARTMAQTGKRVLLLRADMRSPGASPGLSNLLQGQCTGAEVLQREQDCGYLRIIPSGDVAGNPSQLLGSRQMTAALKAMEECFDVVVAELPPISAGPDALILSRHLSAVVVLVERGSRRQELTQSLCQLKVSGCKRLGLVLIEENKKQTESGIKHGDRTENGRNQTKQK